MACTFATKCGPQSDKIPSGTPNFGRILLRNFFATSQLSWSTMGKLQATQKRCLLISKYIHNYYALLIQKNQFANILLENSLFLLPQVEAFILSYN